MEITRRKLLQALSAAPVVAASSRVFGGRKAGVFASASSLPSSSSTPDSAAKGQHLNVILHGLAIVNVPDPSQPQMEILIPYMSGHQYQWGTWRKEVDIAGNGATYNITGTDSGLPSRAAMYPDDNAVMEHVSLINPGMGALPLHCTIKLPFPETIYSMRKVCKHDHSSEFLYGDASYYLMRQPTAISMVHAFRYTIADPAKVAYGNNSLGIDSNSLDFNLHIWADPAGGSHTLEDKNMPSAFERMVESFTGLKVTQCADYRSRSGELSVAEEMPSGMDHYEKYSRSERHEPGWGDGDLPQTRGCTYEEPAAGRARIVTCMALFVYGTQSAK